MKLGFVNSLGVLLCLLLLIGNILGGIVPSKPTNNTTTVKETTKTTTTVKQEATNSCTKITTQEDCLKSPCVWCKTKCITYKTTDLFLLTSTKEFNCSPYDATVKYTWLKTFYFAVLLIVLNVGLWGLAIYGIKKYCC